MVLQRWNGLQMAVQNQWGGSDSDQKFNHLASDLFSSLSKSTGKASSLLHLSPYISFHFPIISIHLLHASISSFPLNEMLLLQLLFFLMNQKIFSTNPCSSLLTPTLKMAALNRFHLYIYNPLPLISLISYTHDYVSTDFCISKNVSRCTILSMAIVPSNIIFMPSKLWCCIINGQMKYQFQMLEIQSRSN